MDDTLNLRAGLAACVFVWVAGAASARAQTVPSHSENSEAVSVILEQTIFWREKHEWDRATNAVSRLLAFEPANADALALEANIAIDADKRDDAAKAVAALKQAHPDDPRIDGIEAVLRRGPIDGQTIEQARAFGRAGQTAEAVAAYEKAFGGPSPPPGYATEYYMLAARTHGTEFAREGLAAEVRHDPQKLDAQLAYAKFLTYTERTRAEGLARLERLQQIPDVSHAAEQALRQVLFWLPVTPDSVREMRRYLARYPQDVAVADLAMSTENNPALIRIAGFAALDAGHLDMAADRFNQAIRSNGSDAAALMGMGVVRLRQERFDEGRALLRQAIAVDPSLEARFSEALKQPAPGSHGARSYSADYGRVGQRIRALDTEASTLSGKPRIRHADQKPRSLGRVASSVREEKTG